GLALGRERARASVRAAHGGPREPLRRRARLPPSRAPRRLRARRRRAHGVRHRPPLLRRRPRREPARDRRDVHRRRAPGRARGVGAPALLPAPTLTEGGVAPWPTPRSRSSRRTSRPTTSRTAGTT